MNSSFGRGVDPNICTRRDNEECLNRLIPFGERHLRRAIREFVAHYHFERHHQGLGNQLIDGTATTGNSIIRRRQRLAGVLNYYYRAT